MAGETPLHLAVALDGFGWHPAAAPGTGSPPGEQFTLRYWASLVREAEQGLLDFVTIEDPLSRTSGTASAAGQNDAGGTSAGPETDGGKAAAPGRGQRLDAVPLAGALAASTTHIGLVPTIVLNHAQPAFAANAIATLDHLSGGRAGWRTQQSPARPIPLADLFTPTVQAMMAERFDRAADLVRVVRALWDGIEDERKLREIAPGRFAPAAGSPPEPGEEASPEGWLIVPEPSTAPRPPQGHPVTFTLAHITIPFRYGARAADVVSVTPHSAAEAAAAVQEIRAEQDAAGRGGETVHVFADLVVYIDPARGGAAARRAALDDQAGAPFFTDAEIIAGTAREVADLMLDWQRAGITGFRLRPGQLPRDLVAITRQLVPELQSRGAFRTDYEAPTLRGLLGLPLPPR